MHRPEFIVLAVAAAFAIRSHAAADSVTLISAHDSTLYQDANGALSNGSGEFFFAGNTSANLIRRGLVFFDVAGALPAEATVNNAMLTLHMSMTSAGVMNVGLHRALNGWGEGASNAAGGEGGGAPAAPGDATWLHTSFNFSFWTNPGGDFNAVASATMAVDAVGFYSWNSAGLTGDVQDWLNNPGANHGWLLKGNESAANTTKRFDTRESLTADFRPMLVIEYTPVPAPGTLVVTIAGGLLSHRRRRR